MKSLISFMILVVLGSVNALYGGDADRFVVFNDRHLTKSDHDAFLINDLPCSKRMGEPTLFCLKSVATLEKQNFNDLKALITAFPATLKNLGLTDMKSVAGMDLVFRSNLSAVVFEPGFDLKKGYGLKEPQLRIEHGTGDPIPKNQFGIYLRVPVPFTLEALKKWAKGKGNAAWGELIVKGYLEKLYELREIRHCTQQDPVFNQYYKSSDIRITPVNPNHLLEYKSEVQELDKFLNADLNKKSEDIKTDVKPKETPKGADSPDGCRAKITKQINDLNAKAEKLEQEIEEEERQEQSEFEQEYDKKKDAEIKLLEENLAELKNKTAPLQARLVEVDSKVVATIEQQQLQSEAKQREFNVTWNSVELDFEGDAANLEAFKAAMTALYATNNKLRSKLETERLSIQKAIKAFGVEKLEWDLKYERKGREKKIRPFHFFSSPRRDDLRSLESLNRAAKEQLRECLISIGEIDPSKEEKDSADSDALQTDQ